MGSIYTLNSPLNVYSGTTISTSPAGGNVACYSYFSVANNYPKGACGVPPPNSVFCHRGD